VFYEKVRDRTGAPLNRLRPVTRIKRSLPTQPTSTPQSVSLKGSNIMMSEPKRSKACSAGKRLNFSSAA
jgi:hypothetical protein